MSEIQGSSILVTGATGFIGRHLTTRLSQLGAQVLGYSMASDPTERSQSNSVDFQSGEIADGQALAKCVDTFTARTGRSLDYIFHLAAQKNPQLARENPAETLQASLMGTLNVLELARRQQDFRKLVLISSVAVYGSRKDQDDNLLTEDQLPCLDSTYAASKIISENLGFAYGREWKIPVIVARLANVYGPGQSTEAVIASMSEQLFDGAKILSLGNTQSQRDFIYVEDVVEALIQLAIAEKAVGFPVNVGTGKGSTVQDVVSILADLHQFKGEIRSDSSKIRVGETTRFVPDTRLLQTLTNWRPRYGLPEGLTQMVGLQKAKRAANGS